jgi:hypothetical protein
MLESRDGNVIPSVVDATGKAHPLHSLIDPLKEADRLVSTIGEAGFIVFLGLGGGYHVEAALKNSRVEKVVIVDFDKDGIAEILSSKDFVSVFNDKRVTFLVDPTVDKIEKLMLDEYNPLLHGNLRSIPLRARCDIEKEKFVPAANAVNASLEKTAMDYSVQSQFGKRWFSNLIRNLFQSEKQNKSIAPLKTAAVCAAGPSLDKQTATIKAKRNDLFVIATDTSLGTLLDNGIMPDAVISIDCQHISHYHFIGIPKMDALLFLDITSPPQLASFSTRPYFFQDAHPLSFFISKYYKSFPFIDTSGGNVTFAAVSLAASLQAKTIELYGADFSYPNGKTYTRGAYIYPYFDARQNRFQSMETLFSSLLFRSNTLKKITINDRWFYQTPSLAMYKNALSNLSKTINATIVPIEGDGDIIPVAAQTHRFNKEYRLFSTGTNVMNAAGFLQFYLDAILSLPALNGNTEQYICELTGLQTEVFLTLLPLAASIKSGTKLSLFGDILEETKQYCEAEIKKALAANA